MKITLLTCNDLTGFIHDDELLVDELKSRGCKVQTKAWENLVDEGEDLFLIRTTWNYTERLEEFVSALDSISDRLLNPIELVKWNANKKYLQELYNKNLWVMPLQIISDNSSLTAAMDELGGDEFIVKPTVGASASGLIQFSKDHPPDINSESIVQKFYPQIANGEVSLVYFKGEFAYALKKTPKPGEIRVQEEYGGVITSYQPTSNELEAAGKIIEEIPGDWLYARVDLVPEFGLIELECIEPSLYFRTNKDAARKLADAILQ